MCFTQTNAQTFEKHKSYVNIGYGIATKRKALFSLHKNNLGYKYSRTGPLFFKYEFAVTKNFGAGINVAYVRETAQWNEMGGLNNSPYTESVLTNGVSIFGRINWQFGNYKKFAPYFGYGIGIRYETIIYSTTNPNAPPSAFESIDLGFPMGGDITFGTRYLFTNTIGAYIELGFAKSFVQCGLSVKI